MSLPSHSKTWYISVVKNICDWVVTSFSYSSTWKLMDMTCNIYMTCWPIKWSSNCTSIFLTYAQICYFQKTVVLKNQCQKFCLLPTFYFKAIEAKSLSALVTNVGLGYFGPDQIVSNSVVDKNGDKVKCCHATNVETIRSECFTRASITFWVRFQGTRVVPHSHND